MWCNHTTENSGKNVTWDHTNGLWGLPANTWPVVREHKKLAKISNPILLAIALRRFISPEPENTCLRNYQDVEWELTAKLSERVYLSRGVLHQCIVTRREKDCYYRFHSLLRSFKSAFTDTYEVYTDNTIRYKHLPTKGKSKSIRKVTVSGFELVAFVLLSMALLLAAGIILLSPILLKKQTAISSLLVFTAGKHFNFANVSSSF